MKKMKIFLPIAIAVLSVVFFSQCKKDHSCNMKLTCYYSSNGMDADSVMPFAEIYFDLSKYQSGIVDSSFFPVSFDPHPAHLAPRPAVNDSNTVVADRFGVYSYTFSYPALLIINAFKIDTVVNGFGDTVYLKYTGTTQVQVNEGETTEKSILLVQTN